MVSLCVVVILLFTTSFQLSSCLNVTIKTENEDFLRIKNYAQKYILFPDGSGKIHLINLHKTVEDNKFNTDKDVYAVINTRNNSPITVNAENKTSLLNYQHVIDFKKQFKIIVHGWTDSKNGDMSVEIRNAYLKNSDVNIVVIDWSVGARVHYGTAVVNVPKTADFLAKFIFWLHTNGVPLENFHLIGHSLGAHIVGIAGRTLNPYKIPYITGLDPALPCWDINSKRITPNDGKYVEIIHTNGGLFGILEVVGSNDFYPNGGSSQPGCNIFGLGCAHKRAYKYFAESIENTKFKGMQCVDLQEMIEKKCANLSTLHMGGSKPKHAIGVFYVQTRKQSPFYLE